MESIEQRETAARGVAADEAPRARRRAASVVFGARAAYLVVGALAVGLAVGYLQFSTPAICCGDFDGYYHIRWSQLLWEGARAGHFPPQFTWLPLTTLNPRAYVDHHFLFHLLQAPFAVLSERLTGDAVRGAKISAWLFASLAIFACYWLVVRENLRYPLLWLAALLGCSAPFLFRMNMTKAMSFSVALLVVGIYLLFRRKYLWLLPLAFLFTLAYDIFVLLGVAAFVWTAVVAWTERRFEWRPLVWVGLGVAAGLIINPYFPQNLVLLYQHALMKFKVTEAGRPAVGNEWYPYESWTFLSNSLVAFIAMLAGYLTCRWEERRHAARALFFLAFSTILLVFNAKWRRFAEYWPPFAVLFAAFSVSSYLDGARRTYGRLPEELMNELSPYLDRRAPEGDTAREGRRREVESALISVAFAALVLGPYALFQPGERGRLLLVGAATLAFVVFVSVHGALRGVRAATLTAVLALLTLSAGFTVWIEGKTEIADSAPPEDYRAGARWLRENVPPGELVFNTDWDDFPKLFFYDPTHAYVSGLDPTYLFDANAGLSRLYEDITLGREKDPGPVIRERFRARYVFTDNEQVHDDFYDAAMDSGWFEEAYADDSCTILRIREQKGEPPPAEGGDDKGDGDGGGQQSPPPPAGASSSGGSL